MFKLLKEQIPTSEAPVEKTAVFQERQCFTVRFDGEFPADQPMPPFF
jgi:hypothetical protein